MNSMLGGLFQLLLFQALGEVISKFGLRMIPGPVLGLVLLLFFLVINKKVPQAMNEAGTSILQHLGLLFVPASVGVVMYWPILQDHLGAVMGALILSVLATIAVSAFVLKLVSRESQGQDHEQ
jgi:putative effector of murein hydrolase LrgA (UPF0299 family)